MSADCTDILIQNIHKQEHKEMLVVNGPPNADLYTI